MFKLEILYEDNNFIAVNKPAGVLVHPTGLNSNEDTIVDWLRLNRPQVLKVGDSPELRPGIVHRLDRDTSGVLIIAKNEEYFRYLKSLFQERELDKTYLALVYGRILSGGVIDKPIGLRNGSTKRTVTSRKARMIKEAVTEYKVRGYTRIDTDRGAQDCTVLEVKPHTGRTHQIRVHLASISHPVVGDRMYGGGRKDDIGRLCLHAYSIELPVASGRRIKIVADPPPELAEIFKPSILP
ncbi:MAG: RluA family pseudouridine synthase [Patescibacteria group bacterium]|nr:RluA family pseudouridine synthase [Patescibacteria group bacterium]MCL5224047.1 RluA family pseudouridine synthase [Patescibacteria group bacterium]